MEQLFGIGIDRIHYRDANPWNGISYNMDENARGILDVSKKTPVIKFPLLSGLEFVRHGFSTRLGGVSEDELSTMNLSNQRGDKPERVKENFRRICSTLELRAEDLVLSDQIHETFVYKAGHEDKQGVFPERKKLSGVDGLVTNEPDVVLVTSYADCVPLFFVDVKNRAIGLSHSGWKGTVGKIGSLTVLKMKELYGSRPEDIVAVIGPSICAGCYETGEDVAGLFRETFNNWDPDRYLNQKDDGHYLLDLWSVNRQLLLEVGILPRNIGVSAICTCCNPSLLFSHRAAGGKRGNLCGFLSIIS